MIASKFFLVSFNSSLAILLAKGRGNVVGIYAAADENPYEEDHACAALTLGHRGGESRKSLLLSNYLASGNFIPLYLRKGRKGVSYISCVPAMGWVLSDILVSFTFTRTFFHLP